MRLTLPLLSAFAVVTVVPAALGGLLGMTIGGIRGRFHHSERWLRRALGTGTAIGFTFPDGSGAVTVSRKF